MKEIAIISLFLSVASAWWGTGHLLTARIAQNILEKEDPDTYNQVVEILQKLKETDPDWTKKEDKHLFTECATYADEIKAYKSGQYQRGWHFIDEPYLDQGGKISDFNFQFDSHNVTQIITEIGMWFRNETGYDQTFTVKSIMNHTYADHSEKNGMSTAMRFLIHYTGDVHQPLHATSRVDKNYTKGDFGGNSVYLPSVQGAKNLHSVWDSVIYEYTGYGELPYSDDAWNTVSKQAQDLIDKYPVDNASVQILDAHKWAADSFELSKEYVYPGVTPNVNLTDEYLSKAKPVAEKQLVIGGHRLANLLKSFKLHDKEVQEEYAEYLRQLKEVQDQKMQKQMKQEVKKEEKEMKKEEKEMKKEVKDEKKEQKKPSKFMRMITPFCDACGYF